MNQERIDEIDRLLDKLNSDNFLEKDIVIDTLCDYVCYHPISPEYKNKITENVIELFNPENTYELQESIFFFLGSVNVQGILQKKILNLMLTHLSNPHPEFMEYAVDTLVVDWPSCYKKNEFKESIEQCLRSENLDVKRVMLAIIKYYQKQGVSLID
jgi:hypothetical protein